MSWPTINDAAWDRFDPENEQREADQLEEDAYEAYRQQGIEEAINRRNREFYDANKSTITYDDGTVEIEESEFCWTDGSPVVVNQDGIIELGDK